MNRWNQLATYLAQLSCTATTAGTRPAGLEGLMTAPADRDADSTPAASDDDERVPWARLSACAGVYTAPTALVVAPALADVRVLAATGWAPGALTLASGLMFVASAPGAVVGSSAADRLGRRPVAFWTTLGCGICIAVGAAAPRQGALLYVAMRVIGGAVSGGTAPTAFSWAMELTPHKARTRATTAMNVLWVLGPLLIAAWHVSTRSASWRVEALGLAAFPLVAACVARLSVPESPEFLAARAAPPPQRESEVYGIVGHLDPDVAAADAVAPTEPVEAPLRSPLARLWHEHRRPLVPLILSWACVSASYYGLAYSAGALSKRVVLNFVLLNLADVPGYFAAGYLTKLAGTEPVMVLFSCLAGVSLVLVALKAPAGVGIFGKFCTVRRQCRFVFEPNRVPPRRRRDVVPGFPATSARVTPSTRHLPRQYATARRRACSSKYMR